MRKRVFSIFLCMLLLSTCLVRTSYPHAETVSTGTVHADSLRIRKEPNTSSTVLGYLNNNDIVTIHDTVKNGNDDWFHITFGSITGYASADYITVNASYTTDGNFENHLTAQRFPEDYKPALRQLHALYPNWVFKAQTLPMTWAAACAGEGTVGRNTIQSPEAWKSMERGAYDWAKGTYVQYDTGGWCAASPTVIAYYMDPRNWLTAEYLFQFEELSYSADQTADGVKAILPDSIDYIAGDLIKAAKETNVSAYFLAVKIVQEGTATNGLATGTVVGYTGYYNYFDIGAYAHDGRTAVQNGAIYAKEKGWNTPYKCLLESAKTTFANSYIANGQNTTYYQKFNVVNAKAYYSHQFMTNVAGAASEGYISFSRLSEQARKQTHTFVIPVYKEMPATVSPRPSTSGNNNNFLNSITVSGCSLTPTFDRYTMEYAAQVDSDVSRVTVSATPSNSGAKVAGTGNIDLSYGSNRIAVTVTATSGETRTYTVMITREGYDADAPHITEKTYAVSQSAITKVEPDTTVAEFIKNLAVQNGTAAVCSPDGKAKTGGAVGTGDIVQLYSGNSLRASYPVIIYGDNTGDGVINSLDLRMAQKHILKVSTLSGCYFTAADASHDGQLNSLDLRMTQKYILKITKSLQ